METKERTVRSFSPFFLLLLSLALCSALLLIGPKMLGPKEAPIRPCESLPLIARMPLRDRRLRSPRQRGGNKGTLFSLRCEESRGTLRPVMNNQRKSKLINLFPIFYRTFQKFLMHTKKHSSMTKKTKSLKKTFFSFMSFGFFFSKLFSKFNRNLIWNEFNKFFENILIIQ